MVSTSFVFAVSEAEYGKISKAWTLKPDGSQEYRYSMELTLFTHTAMNSTYGESFIVYNPKFQEVKIHTSYTKQTDGTLIQTPENAFVEVLPRFATDAPAYNYLKEMVVVHTGLELGATIYLDYSIYSKPGYFPELDVNEILQETSPVKEYAISVNHPSNKAVNCHLYSSNVKSTESEKEGQQSVSWVLKNIPASSRAPFLPQNKNGVPRLIATSYSSTMDALAVLNKRFNESISYETKTFAQYITENASTPKEKVDILQKHVVNNMGNSNIPLVNTGFSVRNIDDVLRSAYGTIAEKTLLLQTMLQAAGISSEIVAIYPGLPVTTYGLTPMKGFAVKVNSDGKDEYLSAVSVSASSIPLHGELDKLFSLEGKEQIIKASPKELKESKEISINSNQIVNGYAICSLPASSGVDSWQMASLNSKREDILEIPSMINEEITYIVTPDKGLTLQTPTGTKTIEKPFGKVSYTVNQKGDKVEVTRTIQLNQIQFNQAEYNDFRALINEWVDPNKRILLFTAK